MDAWNALKSLEGRWFSPDLVTALAAPLSADQQPEPDPVAFGSLPRFLTSPPTPGAVESGLLAGLIADDVLTLRWRPPPKDDNNLDHIGVDWLSRMTEAETVITD